MKCYLKSDRKDTTSEQDDDNHNNRVTIVTRLQLHSSIQPLINHMIRTLQLIITLNFLNGVYQRNFTCLCYEHIDFEGKVSGTY